MLSRLNPAEIRPGRPFSGPEALLRNIEKKSPVLENPAMFQPISNDAKVAPPAFY